MNLDTFCATYAPPKQPEGNPDIDRMSDERFSESTRNWLDSNNYPTDPVGDLWAHSTWSRHIPELFGEDTFNKLKGEFVSVTDLSVATVRECVDLGIERSTVRNLLTLLRAWKRKMGTVEESGGVHVGNIEQVENALDITIEDRDLVR